MKKAYITKIKAIVSMSIFTLFTANAQFVPQQPVIQLPGIPLWTLNAQVRPRGEIRHGLGNPVDAGAPAAAFVSQRTNLNLGFRWDKLNFNVDIRDVRVWGQDASQISNADGNKLFLHQAWGEFILATTADTNCKLKIDNLSVKIGRQEINYDDARLLGNLDWLQQGRRHDAAILKFLHKGYQADLGVAFNQNTDAFNTTGVQYVGYNGTGTNAVGGLNTANAAGLQNQGVPSFAGSAPSTNGLSNNYKMFQYLYLARRFNQTRISALFFKDDFQKFDVNYTNTSSPGVNLGDPAIVSGVGSRAYLSNNDTKSRYTFGAQFSTQIGNSSEGWKTALAGGIYGQFGKDPRAAETVTRKNPNGTLTDLPQVQTLNAGHVFAYATFTNGKWSVGPGYDLLSGNDVEVYETPVSGAAVGGNTYARNVAIGSENNRFDPLYGTPHRWWGYMDVFYVGTGSPSSGLANYYIKAKYTENKWFVSADIHQFMTAGKTVKYKGLNDATLKDMGASYGQELDLIFNYQANKFTNVEFGYSCMLATQALAVSKGFKEGATDEFNQWGYLQINIRPDFLFQKPIAIKN